jgi:hypothetical protein
MGVSEARARRLAQQAESFVREIETHVRNRPE